MKYKLLKKVLSTFVIIFGLLSIGSAIMFVGGGGILNSLDVALEEIENLEKQGLLNNPPENISAITKRELQLVHNSAGLKQYIYEVETSLSNMIYCLYIFTFLFFLSLFLRIYFRKK